MSNYELVGIGNALVDVLARVDDRFLSDHSLQKGAMMLVDANRSAQLYQLMPSTDKVSGGSCGNTMFGFASLGGRGAYVGKVKDDELGRVFRKDMAAIGIHFTTPTAVEGPSTGSCLVLITPDAQRTMCTNLGAAINLSPSDIDKEVIQSAKVIYLEGYLFDPPDAQLAFVKAADIAHEGGQKVSITLSDAFCVDRHRDSFLKFIQEHVDILFGNEEEIKSLYEVTDFNAALQSVRGQCEIVCLTKGAYGSVILAGENSYIIDAMPIKKVVDTTGAGDQYAAGFLWGYTQGMELEICGRIATIAATEIISHVGARPETSLRELVEQNLF